MHYENNVTKISRYESDSQALHGQFQDQKPDHSLNFAAVWRGADIRDCSLSQAFFNLFSSCEPVVCRCTMDIAAVLADKALLATLSREYELLKATNGTCNSFIAPRTYICLPCSLAESFAWLQQHTKRPFPCRIPPVQLMLTGSSGSKHGYSEQQQSTAAAIVQYRSRGCSGRCSINSNNSSYTKANSSSTDHPYVLPSACAHPARRQHAFQRAGQPATAGAAVQLTATACRQHHLKKPVGG